MTAVALGDLGAPVGTGRSALIYAWPEDRRLVVKLFFEHHPAAAIEAERAACAEASRLGVNDVRCHGDVRVGARRGLLFDRMDGESLTRLSERHPLQLRALSRVLARTHAALHEASTDRLEDVRDATAAALDTPPLAFLTEPERAAARRLVGALPSGDRLLHLDFHSDNVFAHEGRHAIIDWQTARRGDPAADVAATVLLLGDAELWPGTPLHRRVMIGMVRRVVLATYLAEYRRITGMTRAEIDAWRVPAVVLRMSTLDLAGEREAFRAELRARLTDRA